MTAEQARESELAALTAGIEEALASNCDGITAFVPVELLHGLLHELAARATLPTEPVAPIDMVLYCPNCGMQHIDADESETLSIDGTPYLTARLGWDNPPHRSHLCHGCGHIWRPADVPTNGVAAVKTKGKADSPVSARIAALEASETEPMLVADVARELGVSAVAVCSKLREAGFGNFSVNMAITRAAAKCVRAAFQRAALEAAAVPPARDVLTAIMRAAESAKEPCGMDPESPAAIRNSKFATIAHMAAQGLGMVRGPAFEAAAVPTSAVVPVEVVTLNDAAFALRMALRDMEAIHCPVPESSALVGYFCNRLRAALATLQAAEPAEDHMTHAEWNRRYFPSGLTPVPDNAVPYTEPAAKKDTAA
jgi:hypothetical protein